MGVVGAPLSLSPSLCRGLPKAVGGDWAKAARGKSRKRWEKDKVEGREGAEEEGGRRERVDGGNAGRGADRDDLDGGCLLCGEAERVGAALVAKAVTRKQGGKERGAGGGRVGGEDARICRSILRGRVLLGTQMHIYVIHSYITK